MNVGVVYKSKQQAVVEKWLALMPGRQEEDGVGLNTGSEICGFLKVSICVYHEKQVPPSLISRGGDAQKEDVVYSAQLLNYCLKVSLFPLIFNSLTYSHFLVSDFQSESVSRLHSSSI